MQQRFGKGGVNATQHRYGGGREGDQGHWSHVCCHGDRAASQVQNNCADLMH